GKRRRVRRTDTDMNTRRTRTRDGIMDIPEKRIGSGGVRLGLAAVALSLALGAACTVGPNYHQPEVPLPATFKEEPPAGIPGATAAGPWKPAQPKDDVLRGKWWEIFGDRELSTFEEQVAVANPTLAQAEAQFRGARAAMAGA